MIIGPSPSAIYRIEFIFWKCVCHIVVITKVKHLLGFLFVVQTLMIGEVAILADVQIFIIEDIPEKRVGKS